MISEKEGADGFAGGPRRWIRLALVGLWVIMALWRPWDRGDDNYDTMPPELAQRVPEAVGWKELGRGVYQLFDANGVTVGRVLTNSGSDDLPVGQMGEVSVAVVLEDGGVSDVVLLRHSEAPSYVSILNKAELFDRWNGLMPEEARDLEVDAVSGATRTSAAVVNGVALLMGASDAPLAVRTPWFVRVSVWFVLVWGVLGHFLPEMMRRFRTPQLITNTVVLGIMTGWLLTLGLMAGWVENGVNLEAQVELILLALLALVLPMLSGRSFYCSELCPYGSAQELAGKLGKCHGKVPVAVGKVLVVIRAVIILLAALAILVLGVDADFASFEPFSVFTVRHAALGSLLLGIVFIAVSFFFPRLWCRFLCPTGWLLSLFRRNRKSKDPEE